MTRNGVVWAKDVERLKERREDLRNLGGGKVFLGVKTKNWEGVLKKPERLLVCSKLFEKRDRAILCMGERENVYIISRGGT